MQSTNPQAIAPTSVVKALDLKQGTSRRNKKLVASIAASLLVVLAGIFTGKVLAQSSGAATRSNNSSKETTSLGAQSSDHDDSDEESESVKGILKIGGIEGEGTHHLDRGAGDDKNVYLISSFVDLDNFAGKKVEIWGKTMGAKSAGWLMDVTKIKESK